MCKDYRRTQAQQNTALLRRIRDFMEPPGYRTSSPSDDNIVVNNPLVSIEVAPVVMAIEDRSGSSETQTGISEC